MFLKGKSCELRVLDPDDNYQVSTYTQSVNAGWTLEYLFTGSIPMRYVDVKASWEKERANGSHELGIWIPNGQDLYDDEGEFAGTTDILVGTVGLYSYRSIYRSYEFRIIIFDPAAIGKGVGTESARLVLQWGFERLNAHRIYLGVSAENTRAIRSYQKVGFVEEGRLRDEIFCHGKYVDAIRMSILEDEWRSINQQS